MRPHRPDKFCLSKIDALTVDLESGRIWRNGREIGLGGQNRRRIGMRKKNGNSVCFYRYQIVWYVATGRWPTKELDHKDGCRWNDSFKNLQMVSHARNCQRAKRSRLPRKIDRQGRSYRVRIHGVYVGRYSTLREAVRARDDQEHKI